MWAGTLHIFEQLGSSSSFPKNNYKYAVFFYHAFSFLQPVKRKKEGEEKRMTQEEMLLEAAETGRASDLFCIYFVFFSLIKS